MTHDLLIRSQKFAEESRLRMQTARDRARGTVKRVELTHQRCANSSFVVSHYTYTVSTAEQGPTS